MDLNLKKNELVKFTSEPDDFPKDFKRFYRNFELLGTPIGDEKFCTEFIAKKVTKKLKHTLEAIGQLEDAQVFHYMVRLTSSMCKVVHLLRAVPPKYCKQALIDFDDAIK